MAHSKAKHREEIDGLRALAVLAVVFYHLRLPGFEGGFVGVDVFFVISGFLITGMLRKSFVEHGRVDLWTFAGSRSRRLFPALFATIVGTFAAGYFLLWAADFARLGGSSFHALLSLSNIYFWSESGYFDAASIKKPLLHTWSLGVEVQFYAIWALLFALAGRLRSLRAVAIILSVLGVASLAANYLVFLPSPEGIERMAQPFRHLFANPDSSIFFLMPFRIFEFAIGALCYWLSKQWDASQIWRELLQGLGLLMVVGFILSVPEGTRWPGLAALIPCAGTAMVILGGQQTYLSKLLTNWPMRHLGNVSYSIYLVHWPLIVFFGIATLRDFTATDIALLLAGTLLLAELLYHFVEKPFRQGKSHVPVTNPVFGLCCTILIMAASLPAASAWSTGGWAWRNDQLANAERFDFEQMRDEVLHYAKVNLSNAGFGTGSPRIVVIGDSHGRDTAVGLDQVLKQHGYEVQLQLLTATCLALLPLDAADHTARDKDCRFQWNRLVNSIKVQAADIIVLSMRWRPTIDQELANFIRVVRSTSRPTNSSILVLGPAIQIREFAPRVRSLLLDGLSVEEVNERLTALDYWRDRDQVMEKITSGEKGAIFASRVDAMCPEGKCSFVFPDGSLKLWDESHWTLAGARDYAERLVSSLPTLFPQPVVSGSIQ